VDPQIGSKNKTKLEPMIPSRRIILIQPFRWRRIWVANQKVKKEMDWQKMKRHCGKNAGFAALEFALIAPLLFPMLLAAVDFGFYAYAFISVQNAVRVSALRNSSGPDSAADQASACALAIEELRGLPNIGASFQSSCGASPLIVYSVKCSSTQPCGGAVPSADGAPAASITVLYTMPAIFTIPFVGPGVIGRTSQMKIRNIQ
jgi:Flp pilus assembly protein TadG